MPIATSYVVPMTGRWDEAAKQRQRARRAARTPEQVAAANAASAARFRVAVKTIERRLDPDYRRGKVARQFVRRLAEATSHSSIAFALGHEEYLRVYAEMFEEQAGRCKICRKTQDKEKRAFAMDHDHLTLELRGLLCFSCNAKLGWLEKWFPQIVRYLK